MAGVFALSHILRRSCMQLVLTPWESPMSVKAPVLSRALLLKYQDSNHTYHSVRIHGAHNSSSPTTIHLCSFSLHCLSFDPSLPFHLFQLLDAHIISSTHGDTCRPCSSSHMHQKKLIFFFSPTVSILPHYCSPAPLPPISGSALWTAQLFYIT